MEMLQNISPIILAVGVSTISLIIGIVFSFIIKRKNKQNTEEKENKNIPNKEYGILDTTRAKTEFDMDDEEIKMFLEELKGQIEEELPIIEKHINDKNYKELKDSVHKIKGSAVNLGENGIAKLLFDFNHYLSENKTDEKEIKEMCEDIYYYKDKII